MREVMNADHCEKILVVDDAAANLHFLYDFLTEHGYAVYPASDGDLALEFVRSILPDLILLDIRIPGMDGFEVCRRLKAEERTRDIPIIFISILEDERDKVEGLAAGAVDYITKPFQPEEVLARIGTHLRLRELTNHLERTVSKRTEELLEVNSRLEIELAERKRIEEKLRESEHRLKESQRISHVGNWELNLASHVLTWSDEVYRIFEIDPEKLSSSYEAFLDTIHPDDREAVNSAYTDSLGAKTPCFFDHRLLFPDGRIKHVHEQCETFFEGDTPTRSIGTVQDITERKRAEEALSLNAERMEVLLHLNQMTDQTLEEITGYAFEAAMNLTRSHLGYLAFANEDETLLTIRLWSQEAMSECRILDKPMVFPVETTGLWGEAIRRRQPIIANDYSASNPWKKGTPEGHVPLKRYLNLPVIVGGKIVLVVGVGNKDEEYNDADAKQRKKAQEKLLENNEELEQRVCDRTKELEANNRELERINKIFIGRELRMTELKKKIKEMESRNGHPEK